MYGVPILTDLEQHLLKVILYAYPCKACGAKPGNACFDSKWSAKQNKTVFLETTDDSIHLGRVPNEGNNESWLNEALQRLNLPILFTADNSPSSQKGNA